MSSECDEYQYFLIDIGKALTTIEHFLFLPFVKRNGFMWYIKLFVEGFVNKSKSSMQLRSLMGVN